MNSTDLFKKDFKEASTIIRNMSEEEVSALQEAVSHMTPSFQSRYARLLVFRKDSLRLLSLLNDGEPELCHNCVKYLKIRAIRKDLMSKLTDEAAFIELFNKSCDLGKSILLECLVWNKDRPTDCLADRLSKNPNLVLNAAQSALLKNARSIEACVEDNAVGRKKYYRLRTRDIEKSALRKLHALYCGYKKEDRSKTENKCDELLCHVHNLTTTITVGEERLTALDIILNLFCVINDDVTRAKFFLNNLPKSTPATLNALSPHMSDTQRAVRLRFCSLTDAFKAVMCLAPIYTMKRIGFAEGYKQQGSYYNDFSCMSLLALIQSATLLEEKEVLDFCLRELARPCHLCCNHNLVTDGELDTIEKVLTPEQFAAFLSALAENTVTVLRRANKSDSVRYSAIPSVVTYLSHHLPGDDERLTTALDLFFGFEKQYLSSCAADAINFYGLQTQEVPRDFSYQMGTREMMAGCKTVRKFEAVLCLKGNTFLNTRDADDRMRALKALVAIAGRSHDVRALSRCLTVYTRTEMKFSDINMDLTPFRTCFAPDALGLSPLSLHMSGSAEEAAAARDALVKSLCEWGQSKKGDVMVEPLMFVLHSLYLYATLYPEHEAIYCDMMKPLVELITNSNMTWSASRARVDFDGFSYRTSKAVDDQMTALRARCLKDCAEVQHYVQFERFCSKQLRYVNSRLPIACPGVVLGTVNFPNPDFAMPVLAKAPLVMIMKLVNEETASSALLCTVLVQLLLHTCSTGVYTVTEEEMCAEKIDGKTVKRSTRTTTPSPDMAVVKALMDDNSFAIKGQFEGVSPFNSLQLISPDVRGFMADLHLSAFKNISYTIVEPPAEKKKKDLFARLLGDKNAMLAYLKSHGSNSIDAEMGAALDDKMKDYVQKLMTVVHVDMSVNGLHCLLDSATSLSLAFSIGSCKKVQLEKVLPLISNETLLKLQKLAALYVYMLLQSAVLAVSLNKSDTPILSPSIISTLSTLQFLFFQMLQTLMLINSTCAYRGIPKDETGLKKEVYLFSVKALAPFVVRWLNAVKDKATQSVEEMKQEDAFKLEEVKEPAAVTLDFSDNEVVGRFVEIIFYSRFVKEYFGKSLGGAVRLISRMDIKTALLICRRFLLISSFVPLGESIINSLLRCASGSSAIIDSIVSMLAESSTSITVALIGLLFRLAANPLMKSRYEQMLQLITTFTNYVISHDFKSEDVYVILLRWAITKVLHPSDVPFDFLKQTLARLTAMKVEDDAGKTVFSIVLLCALYDVQCHGSLRRDISTTSGASSRFHEELNELCKTADKENVDRLRALALELVPQFTVTDESLLTLQCAVLCATRHTEGCAALTATCEKIVREMWRMYENRGNLVSVAALFLFQQKGVAAVKEFEAGMAVYTKLQMLKLQQREISTLPAFRELGISEEDAEMIDHNALDTDLVDSLVSCTYINDKSLFEFCASLDAPDDLLLPLKAFAQAVLKALETTEDFSNLDGVKVNMRTLVAELSKMEPWMVRQLSDHTRDLFLFSEDCLRNLCELAREQRTDTLCWVILFCERNDDEIVEEEANKCRQFIRENKKRELYSYVY